MKILTRMKLINWHRFTDETVEFGERSTLISGENGAGKSTLLDAVQFVLTASTGNFNKAAHENGKRRLSGYVRCKTGRESRPYEREGAVSAHIALEFYEEEKDRYFITGAVIDSASEGQESVARYLIDDARLSDDMFFTDRLSGRSPKSVSEFRSSNKELIKNNWFKTGAETRRMLKQKLGRLEDRFFALIPKALAFKPINNIKDFVYSYVLDEKEVNIELLRENVRTYQDLERTLKLVKAKIKKLENIEISHDEVVEYMENDRMYSYFIARAERDAIYERIDDIQTTARADEKLLDDIAEEIRYADAERSRRREMEMTLHSELDSSEEFRAIEEQKKNLQALRAQENELSAKKDELISSAARARKELQAVRRAGEAGDAADEIDAYERMLGDIEALEETVQLGVLVDAVIEHKKKRAEESNVKLWKLNEQKAETEARIKANNETIKKLEKKKFSYEPAVTRLSDAISAEFADIGRASSPRVLCEQLEITDESWRNAVEGYLNTQRFYILVEPECFDIALGVYDKLRRAGKAYGVGLVNTADLEGYDEAPEGSLASVVGSRDIYAKRFVNMLLGKVMMCERYDDLKKYNTAVTRECMKYQNRVASAMKPKIYEVPFIGSNAVRIQMQQAQELKGSLAAELSEVNESIASEKALAGYLKTENDLAVKFNADIIVRSRMLGVQIKECENSIRELEENVTILEKQMELQKIRADVSELDKKISGLDGKRGNIQGKLRGLEAELKNARLELEKSEQLVQTAFTETGEKGTEWSSDYERMNDGKKSYQDIAAACGRRRKTDRLKRDETERHMVSEMMNYKSEYSFGAEASEAGYAEFEALHKKLKESALLDYEEKAREARAAAEEEFREQFLSKLQENMKQAQSEFKALNKALNDISFSSEKYEFMYSPSKKYDSYYEMIMDDLNAGQGLSLFGGMFREAHREVIDELFEKLALDRGDSGAVLDELTDYRTYMDYDIKITHSDGSHSLYSKVCEEKSGGETQTPFYVTVAASFVQLYSGSIGSEAVGIVMFDEAFNNMDDERIGGVLEFIRRLPLQIIIAAPPDKIQYIGPSVDSTLLVMTDEKVSFVEAYHNVTNALA